MGSGADVIVVGAGPAGSATALLLARRGYAVTLLDRARFPRFKPCGEYLNPAAVAALGRLGVLAGISAQAVSLSGMLVAGPDGRALWAPFAGGRGLLIPRKRLDAALRNEAEAAGARVVEAFRVDAVTAGAAPSVDGRLDGRPARLHARLVVGADGIRSVVARRRGALPPAPNGHYTVGARFAGLNHAVPRGDLHLGRGWYAGAALYGMGEGNVVAAVPLDAFRRGQGAPAVFAEACRALPSLAGLLRGARPVTDFISVGPLGYTRRPAVDDGVLLVGDAAGTVDPMTGEGIAIALRGAELAAEAGDRALRTGAASRAALAGYERARTAAFGETWRVSRLLQWILRRPRLARYLHQGLLRDPGLAATLLSVVSEIRPARDLYSPRFLARLLAAGA